MKWRVKLSININKKIELALMWEIYFSLSLPPSFHHFIIKVSFLLFWINTIMACAFATAAALKLSSSKFREMLYVHFIWQTSYSRANFCSLSFLLIYTILFSLKWYFIHSTSYLSFVSTKKIRRRSLFSFLSQSFEA